MFIIGLKYPSKYGFLSLQKDELEGYFDKIQEYENNIVDCILGKVVNKIYIVCIKFHLLYLF